MESNKTLIGKDVIESLTLGMYEDSRFIYREYIQNAADQIDKAVKENLLAKNEGTIHINIYQNSREAVIEDNATGIPQNQSLRILKNIAQSTKERGVDKGFRGIGRLGGLGYCDLLIFETSYKGENSKSIMTWDAKLLKSIINNRGNREEASQVIDAVTTMEVKPETNDAHYFRVIMKNISNDALLDKKEIEDYLCMVAPVPYDKGFILKQKIYDDLKSRQIGIDEYNIFINTDQVFKRYTTTIYKDVNGRKERTTDELFDIHFIYEKTPNGNQLIWGWYGISKFEAMLDEINIARGIRLRKGNIQVGDNRTLVNFFREHRGNFYFFGELHALSPDLIPNARRDYFLENETCKIFESLITTRLHQELHPIYYEASKIRNANKQIHLVKQMQEEANSKEFVSKKEEEEYQKTFEQKKVEAEKAKKELEKISNKFSTTNSPIKKIFDKVVDTEKIVPSTISINSNDRTKFRTDKLSKLSKEQRKFIGWIYEIINDVLDKKTAESLIKRIEDELK